METWWGASWAISKRRAIILSVEVEGLSLTETAALYGVSKGWVSKLVARYRTEGDSAFEPKSRRPHSSPSRVAEVVNETIVQWHLAQAGHDVSVSTIRRRLVAAGLVTPHPKKRPRTSYIRFEAELPNETWQSDFTHYFLSDGTDTEVLVWLDDHSRYALSVTAHLRVTGRLVVDTFNRTGAIQGFPASTLTDNGLVYTARFAGGKGGRNAFETRLNELKIVQKNSQPNHPTTCGKVERFHQTLKKWLTAQQPQPHTLDQLQAMIDAFVDEYNHRRPHRSLGRTTPAVAYRRLPKTGPAGSNTGPHYRIRHDRIDKTGVVSLRRAGRMHHISIGRAHKHEPVIMLIDDLNIRVVNKQTGELLRALTLDPNRGYHPRFKT